MTVREIMTAPAVTVCEDAPLEDVARLMLYCHEACVAVVRADGSLAGVITEADFAGKRLPVPGCTLRLPNVLGRWLRNPVEKAYVEARTTRAGDVMSRSVVTLCENESVEAAVRMCEHDVHSLPVVRGRVPIGMVTSRSFLKLMLSAPPGSC